ncbi:MAG: peptidylprolyl isomerase, partial [Bacteroidales bacterium]|nr:peptidylprolyl isomerase [Bacteroidales bacterium]
MSNRYINMLIKKYLKTIPVIIAILICSNLRAQEDGNILDQVVAVVGGNIILQSEIEMQYLQFTMQQGATGAAPSVKCEILESILFQKLLLHQSEVDSVEVSDTQVEAELDRRLRYFIAQFGSQEKFEEFYEKSVVEFKEEFRDQVHDQIRIDNVQQTITENTLITPSEVREFYKNIPVDSIPMINSEVEIGQIVKMPPVSKDEEKRVIERLKEFKNRIEAGENFATLAILYSEDPGSAANGGELGLVGRGELFSEFEAVAFSLKDGQVSEIVKTEAGFHIMELIERRGEYVNVRHILLVPKVSTLDLIKAKKELDSIAGLIEDETYTFDDAVLEFSDDPGKNNRGLIINQMSGNSKFEVDQLDPKVFFVIDKLEVDEISASVQFKTEDGKDAYRILMLNSRTDPHMANLKQDYNRIQMWALEEKKSRVIS